MFDPAQAEHEAKQRKLRHYRPLSDAIQDPPTPSISFGLEVLDHTLGGGLAQGLHLLIGYSHAGKSLLAEQCIHSNLDRVVVVVTPDETVDMVVSKLMEMDGLNPNVPLAERRQWALDRAPNLAVQDEVYDTDQLEAYLEEVKFVHGHIDLVVFDYLEKLRGRQVTDEVKSKASYLKFIAKQFEVPLLCIHQGSRGRSADGQALTISSGAYGGEQDAFTVIGVYQKGQANDLSEGQRRFYEQNPQLTVQVLKNKQKRRGGLLPSGVDYIISPTGQLQEPTIADELNPDPGRIARAMFGDGIANVVSQTEREDQ